MSTISVTNINDGDAVTAASINNQVNTIVNDYNGNITDTNVSASAAIGASKIAGGVTGMFGAWTSWTPSLTNMTLGAGGTLACKYVQLGKTVHARFCFTLGSGSAVGTAPVFSLPVTSVSPPVTNMYIGVARLNTTGTSAAWFTWGSTTSAGIVTADANSTFTRETSITAANPFTFASGDAIAGTFTYEAA